MQRDSFHLRVKQSVRLTQPILNTLPATGAYGQGDLNGNDGRNLFMY